MNGAAGWEPLRVLHSGNRHDADAQPEVSTPRVLAVHVIASLSPDETTAALRFAKVLEACGQMRSAEAEEWRRRITGWARFNAVEARERPNA